MVDNATLVTPPPTLVALDGRLSSRYGTGTSISKTSADINPDQAALLSAAVMMLYCVCLAAYDDTSDTHTSKYQPPIAYTPRWDRGRVGRCGMPGISKSEITELIVHLKLSDWLILHGRIAMLDPQDEHYVCYYTGFLHQFA